MKTVIAALMLCCLAGGIASASAMSDQSSWVDQLRNSNDNVCCYDNDGRRLDNPEWDTLGKVEAGNLGGSGYRVYEDYTWHQILNFAVVTMRNHDGIARVWWDRIHETDGTVTKKVRCFLPGSLS